jgi:DnaJ-class molecular chaperone
VACDARAARAAAPAGQTISEKDRCPQCRGNKTVQDKKILEVHVERGMQHNQKIVFRGEADEAVRGRCSRRALLLCAHVSARSAIRCAAGHHPG